ncbi:MAG TPA: hypothetical protein VHW44_23665 [Pseudonocardiaceae bacterium]|jgi:hypothetical protein|nr:hypothetical protein [Pseudonocardiaceae bacterium]
MWTDQGRDDNQEWSRAEYTAFIRANHPDVGGDREVFQAGLAEFRAARRGAARPREADEQPDRFDAPVSVVARLPLGRRVRTRVGRWYRRRKRTRVV